MMKKNYLLLAVLYLCSLGYSEGQDIHFSQFYHAPLFVNPAQTGFFEGDIRFGASYRQQWQAVPVAYNTFSAYHDRKVSERLGAGILFNYDQTGDARLRWAQVGGSAAWHQPLGQAHTLSAGAQVQAGQRAFDPGLLRFGDQHNGELFDPVQASLEAFGSQSRAFIDFSVGAAWHYRRADSRTRASLGLAWAHLNQPLVGFFEDDPARLPQRGAVHAFTAIEASAKADLLLHGLWQFQGPYRELLLGLGGRYYLDAEPGSEVAVSANLSVRLWDAVAVQVGLLYLNWEVGLSYDINTSPFAVATRGRGGPELALRYILARVKPPDEFKVCPVF